MAASLAIEEESGTSLGWTHPHNGYYAGDFTQQREPETTIYGPSDRVFELVSGFGLSGRPSAHLW